MEGIRVKTIREALEMTQTTFSKTLGITCASLSRIESNLQILTVPMRKLICFTFNVNEEWLIEGRGEIFRKSCETDEVKTLLYIFDKLIDINKKLVINHADYLLKSQQTLMGKEAPPEKGGKPASPPVDFPLEPIRPDSDPSDFIEKKRIG